MTIFYGFLPKKGHLEFLGPFFLAEVFQKVSLNPYNFRITTLSARREIPTDEKFLEDKNMPISTVKQSGRENYGHDHTG